MNHDVHELHKQLFQRWEALDEMVRRQLDQQGLRHQDATAILEHVMVVLGRHVKTGKVDPARVDSWEALCAKIAYNEIRNQIRRNKKLILTPRPEDFAPPAPPATDESIIERLGRARLLELIAVLPHPLSLLLAKRYDEGLPIGEAAAQAGVTPKKARDLIYDLRGKVTVVDRGGALRGPDKEAITRFALGVLQLRDRRSGRD